MTIKFRVDYLPSQAMLQRCPRCGISLPHLTLTLQMGTRTDVGQNPRAWGLYICESCAGAVLIEHGLITDPGGDFTISRASHVLIFPDVRKVSDDIPERAARYLNQALGSLSAPDAAVMVAGSAVDAMLKAIGLTDGGVYTRITKARDQGLITQGMADWAHEVRLAANDQRHSDEDSEHATTEDAERLVEFALAFAEFLFVLPARVKRGRQPKLE